MRNEKQLAMPTVSEAFASSMKAYKDYEDAVSRLAMEEDKSATDRVELEKEKMDLLARTDPAVMGKNEEQRKAWLYKAMESHILQGQARLRSVELLKCEAEIARIRCRAGDNALRYMELVAYSCGEEEEIA